MVDPSNADEGRLVWVSDLVPLLSPTLGDEKSAEVLGVAARQLGLAPPFKPDEARAILRTLASGTGIVGVAARFATARASTMFRALGAPPVSSRVESNPTSSPTSSQNDHEIDPRRASGRRPAITLPATEHRIAVHRLVELLAPSVGQEKSEEEVRDAMVRLGFEGDSLDARQSLRVLELLAATGGIVGVTARFAKARLLLLFPA
jgi:hypothetical protein